jgi:hypothetical protein
MEYSCLREAGTESGLLSQMAWKEPKITRAGMVWVKKGQVSVRLWFAGDEAAFPWQWVAILRVCDAVKLLCDVD